MQNSRFTRIRAALAGGLGMIPPGFLGLSRRGRPTKVANPVVQEAAAQKRLRKQQKRLSYGSCQQY